MSHYKPLYKCRRCNSEFSPAVATDRKGMEKCLQALQEAERFRNPFSVFRLEYHDCDHGGFGIGDLVGAVECE